MNTGWGAFVLGMVVVCFTCGLIIWEDVLTDDEGYRPWDKK